MKKNLLSYLFIVVALCPAISVAAVKSPEATEKQRAIAVKEFFKKEPQAIAIYVKGLSCSSCGIGIRRKLSKLRFVNKQRFNKGIDFNTDRQLAFIAINKGARIEYSSISKAVVEAGFAPVFLYQSKGGKTTRSPLKSGK